MKPTIVVVENDLIVARVIQKILVEEGYNVVTVVTVEFAKKVIQENNPILIVINVCLQGGKDGISLGHFLLKKRATPYIYISSVFDKFTLERVKETYPQGFISQPFRKNDLLATVSIVISNFKYFYVDNEYTKNRSVEIPYALKEVVNFIDENINEKITIYDLAIRSRWKEQHFIKVFTNYIGVTPYQFVLLKKIEKAQKLIIETDITVVDIAFELGFLSYTNFSNAFKKITGKTPGNYRINYGAVVIN